MLTYPGKERSCDPSVAETIIVSWIKSQNFKIDWVHEDTYYHTAHVYLRDANGKFVVNGMGKGKSYRLGSLAEAIEHYFGAHETEDDVHFVPAQSIAHQADAKSCGLLTSLEKFSSELVPTASYFPYSFTTDTCLAVPLVLVNPWLNHDGVDSESKDFLSRYSYSTGTALGLTLEDALLHALNEQIERHYLSEFYMYILGLKHRLQFVEIDKNTIKEWDKYSEFLTKEYRWKIILGQGMADVFFCLAVGSSYHSSQPMSVLGSGASLHKDVALERALTEIIQGHCCVSENTIKQDAEVKRSLDKNHLLKKLIFIEDYLFKRVDWDEIKDKVTYYSTRQQVDQLNQWLTFKKHPVYYRIKTPPYSPFVVVSTFVPGLERFHLIREGSFVAPQSWLNPYG